MSEIAGAKPIIKHKKFTYRTQLEWMGGRAGVLQAWDRPSFRIASPPEFKGEAGVWTPEDLFVAAVDSCTMTTFMAFAKRKEIPVISYRGDAEGTLEFVDGSYRFTQVILRPVITVAAEKWIPEAREVLEDAHKRCLIANSITAEIIVHAEIREREKN